MSISKTIWGALGALAFLALLGWAGNEDFKSEVLSQVRYCDNVRAGIWPDYDNTAQYCEQTYQTLAELFPAYSQKDLEQ